MDFKNITLCLTIGRRPTELKQTLDSLLQYLPFEHIIAINDLGDEATNQVFLSCCPNGQLINLGENLGHHKAIDFMYEKVQTDYIFHCEDDWFFDGGLDLDNTIKLLESNENISCICLRKITDFLYDEKDRKQINKVTNDDIDYFRLDHIHDQWYGYSFNPHIAKKSLWQSYAPFARFKKERHISRFLRKKGYYMLYLDQGICYHIGHQSISNPPKNFWQKMKFW